MMRPIVLVLVLVLDGTSRICGHLMIWSAPSREALFAAVKRPEQRALRYVFMWAMQSAIRLDQRFHTGYYRCGP
jgi:hypothetical protein